MQIYSARAAAERVCCVPVPVPHHIIFNRSLSLPLQKGRDGHDIPAPKAPFPCKDSVG